MLKSGKPFCLVALRSKLDLTLFFREKEDDLERRFEILNRELRAMMAIEGRSRRIVAELCTLRI